MKFVAVALLSGLLVTSCANVECSFNSDCGEHARCELNRCMRDCLEDRDCEEGSTCNPNGFCIKRVPTEDVPEVVVDTPAPVDRGVSVADAGTDVGRDAGTDVGFDVGTDAGFDVGTDAGFDVGDDTVLIIGSDVGRDAGFDAGFDVGFDVGTDVGFDVGTDVGRDVGTDAGGPAGPVAVGVYEYTAVRPNGVTAPVAVAWHPGGGYALILSASNTVFRYVASTMALTQVAAVGSTVSWRNLAFTPDGSRALLLGNAGSGAAARGHIYVWDDATGMVAERTSEASSTGTYQALKWSPDGSRAVLLTLNPSSLTFWRYDAGGNRTGAPFGYGIVMNAAHNDLAWVRDGFGDPALMVTCGINTSGILSVTQLDTTPVISLAVIGSRTGNTYRIAARPQGDAALTIGSSSKLYRYRDGVWFVDFDLSPFLAFAVGTSFSSDGARALAFGGFGRAYEYRYDLYSAAAITDVRMPDLAAAPYVQPTNANLNDMAWRPGCHEGIAVGGANTFSGTSAFVAYFRVLNGVRCN